MTIGQAITIGIAEEGVAASSAFLSQGVSELFLTCWLVTTLKSSMPFGNKGSRDNPTNPEPDNLTTSHQCLSATRGLGTEHIEQGHSVVLLSSMPFGNKGSRDRMAIKKGLSQVESSMPFGNKGSRDEAFRELSLKAWNGHQCLSATGGLGTKPNKDMFTCTPFINAFRQQGVSGLDRLIIFLFERKGSSMPFGNKGSRDS